MDAQIRVSRRRAIEEPVCRHGGETIYMVIRASFIVSNSKERPMHVKKNFEELLYDSFSIPPSNCSDS